MNDDEALLQQWPPHLRGTDARCLSAEAARASSLAAPLLHIVAASASNSEKAKETKIKRSELIMDEGIWGFPD